MFQYSVMVMTWMILGYPHDETETSKSWRKPSGHQGMFESYGHGNNRWVIYFPLNQQNVGCSSQEKRHPQKHRTQIQQSVDSIDHEVDILTCGWVKQLISIFGETAVLIGEAPHQQLTEPKKLGMVIIWGDGRKKHHGMIWQSIGI